MRYNFGGGIYSLRRLTMKQRLEQEMKMFLAEFINQLWFLVFGRWSPKWVLRKILGLTLRQIHTLTERSKMKEKNFKLWFAILERDGWQCQRCRVKNFENKEWGKPKMQVDHIVPIYHWGKTERSNLQTLCAPCNKAKGARLNW